MFPFAFIIFFGVNLTLVKLDEEIAIAIGFSTQSKLAE
jgi:hypothetical protein